ncbi:MAG: hypothetical protein Tsb0020_25940 [Haliangiales bacterium]
MPLDDTEYNGDPEMSELVASEAELSEFESIPDGIDTQSTCFSDCDCPPSDVCQSGQCTLDFGPHPQCRCNNHCATGLFCSNGFCVSNECASDCDCAPTDRCQNGQCTPDFSPHPECVCDNHCSGYNERCVNGSCELTCNQGGACLNSSMCGPGGTCYAYPQQCYGAICYGTCFCS